MCGHEEDGAGTTIEPPNPNLTTRELIERAQREHSECIRKWSGTRGKRTMLLHPIEAHLPPEIGRVHMSYYQRSRSE